MDDIVSVQSVQPLDQLSFWSLTFSSLLKLVAMAVTVSVLPFNKWILLKRPDSPLVPIRGISGSDCLLDEQPDSIHCVHWTDAPGVQHSFWAKLGGISAAQVDLPNSTFAFLPTDEVLIENALRAKLQDGSKPQNADDYLQTRIFNAFARNKRLKSSARNFLHRPPAINYPQFSVHRLLFYLVLLQLLLFLLDICATLVMCCRYREQKDAETKEKRVSLGLSGSILFLYALVALSALFSNYDFTHSQPPFRSCMGTAFKLYCAMFLMFAVGSVLAHSSRILVIRERLLAKKGRRNGEGAPEEGVQLR